MIQLASTIAAFVVNYAAAISAIVAVCVFAKSIYEYTLLNRLRRFEKYQEIAGQWDENKDLQIIRHLIDNDQHKKLADTPADTKQHFINCYEDIALMLENRLLSERLAFYMFGFYAIRAHESDDFWHGLDRNDLYYTLFRSFCVRMKEVEEGARRNGLAANELKV